MQTDWKRLAKQDLTRLKDGVLALQEFLRRNEVTLRRRLNEKEFGVDLRRLARRLREEDSVDDVTRQKFFNLIENMGEGELQARTEEFNERLKRISKWLLSLEEVESEAESAG